MKLGSRQKNVLESLVYFGGWSADSGWVWDTPSGTDKILESLCKYDLVKRTGTSYGYGIYEPTEKGIEYNEIIT